MRMNLKLLLPLAIAIMLAGQVQSQTQSQIEELEVEVQRLLANRIGVWVPARFLSDEKNIPLNAGPGANMANALVQIGFWRAIYFDNPEHLAREKHRRDQLAKGIHPNTIGQKYIPRYVVQFTDLNPPGEALRGFQNGHFYLRAGIVRSVRVIEIVKANASNCDWDVRIRTWFNDFEQKNNPVLKAWDMITDRDGFDHWYCYGYDRTGLAIKSSRGVFE